MFGPGNDGKQHGRVSGPKRSVAPLVVMAVIGILSSAVSVYYYFRVVMVMYMEPRGESQPAVEFSKAPSLLAVLVVLVLATLFLGIFPGGFIEAARASIAGFI